MKKLWQEPEVRELGVSSTEQSPYDAESVDGTIYDRNGNKWVSRS